LYATIVHQVSRLCETKSPYQGRQVIAPHKRRGFGGAQCGVMTSRQSKNPEAGDSEEETNSFEWVMKDLIRGLIGVYMRAFEILKSINWLTEHPSHAMRVGPGSHWQGRSNPVTS